MPARLLIAGTACAIAAAVIVGVLLALAGGTDGTDRKAQDRALLSAASAELNWQIGVQSWAKAAVAAAVPTPAPQPSPTPIPEQAAPPAAAVEAVPAEPPASAPPQQEEQSPPPPPSEWLDAEFTASVLAQLNAVREANGVPALATNGALAATAEHYSHTLTQLHVLDHAADGSDLLGRVQANGFYDNVRLGEVLWYGSGAPSASDPVNGWMGSPAHHDILLDPAYHQAGAGCYFRNGGDQPEVRCVVEVAG
jgi:uncharacterized protein YkwD